MLLSAYLLEVEEARTGLLSPLARFTAPTWSIIGCVASALWGITTVFEKLAIEHMTPPSGPFVTLAGTVLMVAFLTPHAFYSRGKAETREQKRAMSGLRGHPRALIGAVLIAGVAALFGFSTIALGLVGYGTALFKLAAVFTIVWAWLFLGEENVLQRLLGTGVMVTGGILIAV